jgi:hypothetical protein
MGVYERLQQDNTRDFSWLIQQVLLPRPPDSTTTLPASDVQQSIVPASLHNQQHPYNLDAFVDQYGPTASPNPLIAPPQPYINTPHQSQDIFAIPANSSPIYTEGESNDSISELLEQWNSDEIAVQTPFDPSAIGLNRAWPTCLRGLAIYCYCNSCYHRGGFP